VSHGLAVLVMLSLAGLLAGRIFFDIWQGRPRRLWPTAVMLLVSAGVYFYAFREEVESKGAVDEGLAVALCYVAMLLGMVAEYFYRQVERGRRRFRWEPMTFMMPIFASPIVFIPLLTLIDVSEGGVFAKAKLMVYLVAFQNGFFWKGFFEKRRNEHHGAAPDLARVS
jgi:hypothetical protein